MAFIKTFIITFVTCFIIDMIWLGWLAKAMYQDQLNHLLRMVDGQLQPNWLAAFVVYIAIPLGITVFVLPKANGHVFMAFLYGALFGCITYAIYDFTNLAILNGWPLSMSIIDVLWGTTLCGITAWLSTLILSWLSS